MRVATVNVSFPKPLLKAIDEVAGEESRTRSELLREATRMYIERKRRWKAVSAYWRGLAKSRGMKPRDVERLIRDVRADRATR